MARSTRRSSSWAARSAIAELEALADRAAKGFQALGVKPGVHVGLFLPNSPHYAIAFFGVLKAGGAVVNYSPLDAEKVLEHKVADSETDILVTLDLAALYPQMSGLLGKTRVKHLVIGDLAEFSGSPQGVRAHLAAGKQLAEVAPDPRHVAFAKLIDNDGKPHVYPVADPKETIAVLQYTGGTTGLPKGAMLTHANLTAAIAQSLETTHTQPPLLVFGEESDARRCCRRSTSMRWPSCCCSACGSAPKLVLHVRFDAEAALKDIEAKKISAVPRRSHDVCCDPASPRGEGRRICVR